MTFNDMTSIYTYALWIALAIVLILLIYRTLPVLSGKQNRLPFKQVKGQYFVKILKIALVPALILTAVNSIFYVYIAFAFKPIVPDLLNHLLVIFTLWLVIWELFLSSSISVKLIESTFKKTVLTFIVLLVLPSSIYMAFYIPAMFEFPEDQECLIIDMPVKGVWLAGNAGGSQMMNLHNFVNCQRYAIDMVMVNESNKFYENTGDSIQDHICYDEVVYSPVNGKVVRVVDSLENSPVSLLVNERTNPAGNHLVIEMDDEHYLFLAHLNKYSIIAEVGDMVKIGEPLGRIGNSGNTTWPHLHLHIQDLPDLDYKNATGMPFLFRNIERKRWLSWQFLKQGQIIKNDLFRRQND